VNVLVSFADALASGNTGSATHQVVTLVASGVLLGRPVQIIASHAMIDTLARVLRRRGFGDGQILLVTQAWSDLLKYGPERLDPYLVLGGSPAPGLPDVEDGSVMAAAIAAGAQILVTSNLRDFSHGATETFVTTRTRLKSGAEKDLTAHIHRMPDGHELVVCHPIDMIIALNRGYILTPEELRKRCA
jgi:hypothetical protein